MNFNQAINLLASKQDKKIKGGIASVKAAFSKLGNPQEKFKCIHVTGTNGKGSVCALFENACRAAGLKTGLFISPHLVNFTERIQTNGKEISKERIASLCEDINAIAPDLSFFELLTVIAFVYFAQENVDIAIVEVGIGGRLDCTNVLPKPLLSVITSISLDHKLQLGHTIKEIAYQKAGIIKNGGICLASSLIPQEAKIEIEKEAKSKNAEVFFADPVFEITERQWYKGQICIKHKESGVVFPYAIQGEAQIINASILWYGAELLKREGLPIGNKEAALAFRNVRWLGRFQTIKSGKKFPNALFILDGAHNPEAAKFFCETWRKSPFVTKKAAFVIAILREKDRISIMRRLAEFDGCFIFTQTSSERAVPAEVLAKEFHTIKQGANVQVCNLPEEAIKLASKSEVAAVLGSFYLAGEAIKILEF